MITDEQVRAAVSTYHDAYHHHPQIMADMRKALEAYEQSKWVRFDINDKDTHPENGKYVLVAINKNILNELGYLDNTYVAEFLNTGFDVYLADECGDYVTRWQPLPEFKE